MNRRQTNCNSRALFFSGRGVPGFLLALSTALLVFTSCIKKTASAPKALSHDDFLRCTGEAEVIPVRDAGPMQQELARLQEKFASVPEPAVRDSKIDAELCSWLGSYFKSVNKTSLGLVDFDWTFALGQNQDKLNVLEKDLFNQNPISGIQALVIANKAKERQEQLFAKINPRSRNGDAFKHTYWNALLARHLGPEVALLWGDAHEHPSSPNPLLERKMDFLNNAIGRKLGSALNTASDEELERAVFAEMKASRLWRVCNNTPKPGAVESYAGVLLPTSDNMADSLDQPCDGAPGFDAALVQALANSNDCPWYLVSPATRHIRSDNAQIAVLYSVPQGNQVIGGVGELGSEKAEAIYMKRLDLAGTRFKVAIYGAAVLRNRLGWIEQAELEPIERFCAKSADFAALLGQGRPSLTGKNAY